jgi:hypothetical protein
MDTQNTTLFFFSNSFSPQIAVIKAC